MSVWSRLFGRPHERGVLAGDGEFAFHVVGTSLHQEALEYLCGRRTPSGVRHYCAALLQPRQNHADDPIAVAVIIDDLEVGQLEQDVAPDFLKVLSKGRFAEAVCEALIVGGWDRGGHDWGYYLVRLNTCMPFNIYSMVEWQQRRENS